MSNQSVYAGLCKKLAKTKLQPNNGKKTDPAHPAIYPTGIMPKLDDRMGKIYDLVVRRFMATFGNPAVRETMNIFIDVNKELFVAKGTRTVEKGWHVYYGPYVKIEEIELPAVKKGDIVKIKKIDMLEKQTEPPRRYTPASIIRELEKRDLGTKATRATIVDTLFQRGYVHGKAIKATELGIRTTETLEKYVPKIIDEEMTRHFELEMEDIREGKKKEKDVLEEAKKEIIKIIDEFKKKEKAIGKELLGAHRETRDKMATLGQCPNCKKGVLQIRKGKFGAFAACNGYPKCKTTFSLPNNTKIVPSDKICETCSFPMVKKILKRKQPQEFCLNPHCKSKHVEGKAGKEAKAVAKGKIEKKCPKCDGMLVLRSSIYGKFYGCSSYPKCKYIEKLENNEDKKVENNKKQ